MPNASAFGDALNSIQKLLMTMFCTAQRVGGRAKRTHPNHLNLHLKFPHHRDNTRPALRMTKLVAITRFEADLKVKPRVQRENVGDGAR
jgi:hypothetical protein